MRCLNYDFTVVVVELVDKEDETSEGVSSFHRKLWNVTQDYRVKVLCQGHEICRAFGRITHFLESHFAYTLSLFVNEELPPLGNLYLGCSTRRAIRQRVPRMLDFSFSLFGTSRMIVIFNRHRM
jgi:hypothetical protein